MDRVQCVRPSRRGPRSGVFHRKAHKVEVREALLWSAIWIGLAMAFGYLVWHWFGPNAGLEITRAPDREGSENRQFIRVSGDLPVIQGRPTRTASRVEFGIIGALFMRGVMIAAGAALVSRFEWVLMLFGLFLVYTGMHMIWKRNKEVHYERNPIFRFANRHLRVTNEYDGGKFFVCRSGELFATRCLWC